MSRAAITLFSLLLLSFLASLSRAQESPYIVAYDHYLEEPGNLDIEYFSTFGTQRGGNNYHAFWMEFEYGATAGHRHHHADALCATRSGTSGFHRAAQSGHDRGWLGWRWRYRR